MSDSDRGGNAKTGLKRWLVPAGLFAAALVGYGGIQTWHYHDNASRSAATHARNADYHVAAKCAVFDAAPSCKREINNAAREHQRSEYDLYSQQTMALWTGIMGAMAVMGVSLSGVGVYLIWRTWDATREAAENSRKTLRAYIAKERAILRIRSAKHIYDDRLPYPECFVAKVTNIADSPAEIEAIRWEYLNGPIWPKELQFTRFSNTIVPAKSDSISEILSPSKDAIGGTWLAVAVSYFTIQEGPFWAHAAFQIIHPEADFGTGAWSAEIALIADMPQDT